MARPTLFVTRRLPEAVETRLAADFDVTLNLADRQLGPQDIRDALASHDALLVTVTDPLNADTMRVEEPRTRIIANFGVGYSHIDTATATRNGIVVTNTPDVLSECTADLAVMMMLMVARRAGEGERELRAGEWTGWRPTHLVGTSVTGKTLGIIGFGRIGREVARRARHGFGMDIVVQNRSPVAAEKLDAAGARQVQTVEELLAQSDFVSLHCPGGTENRHLISRERLALMRPGAFLINTARGEVVDENALADALAAGSIGGAALDVFDGEPRINPALMDCKNLVMLPHLGSATRETREAMGFRAMDNLIDFFAGRPPRDRVA